MDRNWSRRRGKGHAQRRRLERKVKELEDRLSEAGRKRQREQQQHDLTPPRALLDTAERNEDTEGGLKEPAADLQASARRCAVVREQQQELDTQGRKLLDTLSALTTAAGCCAQDPQHQEVTADAFWLLQCLMKKSNEYLKASAPHAVIPGIVPFGDDTGQLDVDKQAAACDQSVELLKECVENHLLTLRRWQDALKEQLSTSEDLGQARHKLAQINALTNAEISSNQRTTIERLEAELVAQSQHTTGWQAIAQEATAQDNTVQDTAALDAAAQGVGRPAVLVDSDTLQQATVAMCHGFVESGFRKACHNHYPYLGRIIGCRMTIIQDLKEALSDTHVTRKRMRHIRESFYTKQIDDGVLLYNYKDSSARNFLSGGAPPGETSGVARKAELRREYRGLVMRSDGTVIARPLHKFFTVDQVPEVELDKLLHKEIAAVTKKLDGQMVMGLVVAGRAQFWTRAGPTEVGMQAYAASQALTGDYSGFIEFIASLHCTPVFEFIGHQSKIKAFEQNQTRIVLVSVRFNRSGEYWSDQTAAKWAQQYGIPMVQRLEYLESWNLEDIRKDVFSWHNCEGVVVRFTDGQWVKIKSKWWCNTGYTKHFTDKIQDRILASKEKLQMKKYRLQHHSLRLAIKNLGHDINPSHINKRFPGARKVDMVYSPNGRLRVAILAFESMAERDQVLCDPLHSDLCLEKAYSARTRTNCKVVVTNHTF